MYPVCDDVLRGIVCAAVFVCACVCVCLFVCVFLYMCVWFVNVLL